MKYRSRLDIISSIMHCSSNGGATKTRIMYGAFLSYAQVKDYLAFLMEKELMSYEEGTQVYKPTEKGLHFLQVADSMEALLGLQFDAVQDSSLPPPMR